MKMMTPVAARAEIPAAAAAATAMMRKMAPGKETGKAKEPLNLSNKRSLISSEESREQS
jgi:hypothetical protein